jgi:hypothetical protein
MCIRFHLVLFLFLFSLFLFFFLDISLFFFLVRRIHHKSSLGRRVVYDWIGGIGYISVLVRAKTYGTVGGWGEDEKGLIVMFTTV